MDARILLTLCAIIHAQAFEFVPLKSYGIYFEKISTAYTTHKNWNIIYQYNLKDLRVAIEQIKTNIYELNEYCAENYANLECKTDLKTINHKLRSLISEKKLVESFETSIKNKIGRTKRGIFLTNPLKMAEMEFNYLKKDPEQNAVDELFTKIFPSDNDPLQTLESELQNTKTITKGQLDLINKIVEFYNESIQNLTRKINSLQSKIKNTTQEEKFTKQQREAFNLASEHTAATIHILEKASKYVLNILSNTPGNDILNFITIEQLHTETKNIKTYLKKWEKLPIELNNEVDVLKIIKCESFLNNQVLVIKIKIPILDANKKSLYKQTAIPVKFNKLTKIIDLNTKYAIINDSSYTSLTNSELENCQQVDTFLVCKTSNPTYTNNSCELSIFQKKNSLSNLCTFLETVQQNRFLPLYQENTYFVSIQHPTTITAICENASDYRQILSEDGILKIPKNCEVKNENLEIKSHNDISLYTSISSKIDTTINNQIITDNNSEQELENDDIDSNFSEKSNLIREKIEEQMSIHSKGTNHFKQGNLRTKQKSVIILTGVFFIILILYVLERKFHIIDNMKNYFNHFAIVTMRN